MSETDKLISLINTGQLSNIELALIMAKELNIIQQVFKPYRQLSKYKNIPFQEDEAFLHKLVNSKYLTIKNKSLKNFPEDLISMSWIKDIQVDDNLIAQIPEDIDKMATLETLSIYNNCIKKLPENIWNCSELKRLFIGKNSITEFPDIHHENTVLETISAPENNFSKLPKSFSKLKALKEFYFSKNQLTSFPIVLIEMKLQRLYLSHNPLFELPNSIEFLSELTDLMLRNTGISTLPKTFKNLGKLHFLDLSQNNLSKIPDPLFTMKSLRILELSRNKIRLETTDDWALLEDLMNSLPNLQELRLGWNNIGNIPDHFMTGPLSNRVVLEEKEYGEY